MAKSNNLENLIEQNLRPLEGLSAEENHFLTLATADVLDFLITPELRSVQGKDALAKAAFEQTAVVRGVRNVTAAEIRGILHELYYVRRQGILPPERVENIRAAVRDVLAKMGIFTRADFSSAARGSDGRRTKEMLHNKNVALVITGGENMFETNRKSSVKRIALKVNDAILYTMASALFSTPASFLRRSS